MSESARCAGCGADLTGRPTCGRCGLRVAPAATPVAAPNSGTAGLTVDRATLSVAEPHLAERVPPEVPLPPPPPPPRQTYGPPPQHGPVRQPYPRSGTGVPLEVGVVAVVLFALGGLLLYPVLRYGFPLLSGLFSPDKFERALAALLWFFFVIIGGCGLSFVLLAIGLWRGSRVCQLLTWFVCGILGFSVLASAEQSGTGVTNGIVAGIVIGCVVSALLLALPGARQHFVGDGELPLGVAIAIAVGRWYGTVIVVCGLILMIAGTVQAKFVAWGLLLALAGTGLFAVGHGLAAGQQWARVAATICYIADVVFCFVSQGEQGSSDSVTTLVPLGIAIAVIVGLWAPATSNAHFATRRMMPPLPWTAEGAGSWSSR